MPETKGKLRISLDYDENVEYNLVGIMEHPIKGNVPFYAYLDVGEDAGVLPDDEKVVWTGDHVFNKKVQFDNGFDVIGQKAEFHAGVLIEHGLEVHDGAVISGDTSVDGQLNVTQQANLNSNVNIGGNLIVDKDETVHGKQTVDGSSTIGGDSTIGGKQTVAGAIEATGNIDTHGNLTVGGTANIGGATTIGGDTNIDGDLTVTGGGNFNGRPLKEGAFRDVGIEPGNVVEVLASGKIADELIPPIAIAETFVDPFADTLQEIADFLNTPQDKIPNQSDIIVVSSGNMTGTYIIINTKAVGDYTPSDFTPLKVPLGSVTVINVNGLSYNPANGVVTLGQYVTDIVLAPSDSHASISAPVVGGGKKTFTITVPKAAIGVRGGTVELGQTLGSTRQDQAATPKMVTDAMKAVLSSMQPNWSATYYNLPDEAPMPTSMGKPLTDAEFDPVIVGPISGSRLNYGSVGIATPWGGPNSFNYKSNLHWQTGVALKDSTGATKTFLQILTNGNELNTYWRNNKTGDVRTEFNKNYADITINTPSDIFSTLKSISFNFNADWQATRSDANFSFPGFIGIYVSSDNGATFQMYSDKDFRYDSKNVLFYPAQATNGINCITTKAYEIKSSKLIVRLAFAVGNNTEVGAFEPNVYFFIRNLVISGLSAQIVIPSGDSLSSLRIGADGTETMELHNAGSLTLLGDKNIKTTLSGTGEDAVINIDGQNIADTTEENEFEKTQTFSQGAKSPVPAINRDDLTNLNDVRVEISDIISTSGASYGTQLEVLTSTFRAATSAEKQAVIGGTITADPIVASIDMGTLGDAIVYTGVRPPAPNPPTDRYGQISIDNGWFNTQISTPAWNSSPTPSYNKCYYEFTIHSGDQDNVMISSIYYEWNLWKSTNGPSVKISTQVFASIDGGATFSAITPITSATNNSSVNSYLENSQQVKEYISLAEADNVILRIAFCSDTLSQQNFLYLRNIKIQAQNNPDFTKFATKEGDQTFTGENIFEQPVTVGAPTSDNHALRKVDAYNNYLDKTTDSQQHIVGTINFDKTPTSSGVAEKDNDLMTMTDVKNIVYSKDTASETYFTSLRGSSGYTNASLVEITPTILGNLASIVAGCGGYIGGASGSSELVLRNQVGSVYIPNASGQSGQDIGFMVTNTNHTSWADTLNSTSPDLHYYQLTFADASGLSLELNSVSFEWNAFTAAATSSFRTAIYYSIDNGVTFQRLTEDKVVELQPNIPLANAQIVSGTGSIKGKNILIRICFGGGVPSSGAYFHFIRNIQIAGTTQSTTRYIRDITIKADDGNSMIVDGGQMELTIAGVESDYIATSITDVITDGSTVKAQVGIKFKFDEAAEALSQEDLGVSGVWNFENGATSAQWAKEPFQLANRNSTVAISAILGEIAWEKAYNNTNVDYSLSGSVIDSVQNYVGAYSTVHRVETVSGTTYSAGRVLGDFNTFKSYSNCPIVKVFRIKSNDERYGGLITFSQGVPVIPTFPNNADINTTVFQTESLTSEGSWWVEIMPQGVSNTNIRGHNLLSGRVRIFQGGTAGSVIRTFNYLLPDSEAVNNFDNVAVVIWQDGNAAYVGLWAPSGKLYRIGAFFQWVNRGTPGNLAAGHDYWSIHDIASYNSTILETTWTVEPTRYLSNGEYALAVAKYLTEISTSVMS